MIKVAQALGMKVLAYVRTPRADEDNLKYVSFEELLKQSDYISLHCPLTPQTRHMINKETIAMMNRQLTLLIPDAVPLLMNRR